MTNSERTIVNVIPNSFCKSKNTFHKLILQKYHNMIALRTELAKSARKKVNIFSIVSPMFSTGVNPQ